MSILFFNAYSFDKSNINNFKDTTDSQKINTKYLVGTWYGNQLNKEGGFREEIAYKNIDGTYKLHFRFHDKNGSYYDQIEVGEWGVSGDIIFSIFKGWIKNGVFVPADQNGAFTRDAYKILKLTEHEIIYKSLDGDDIYKNKKVASNFKFLNTRP